MFLNTRECRKCREYLLAVRECFSYFSIIRKHFQMLISLNIKQSLRAIIWMWSGNITWKYCKVKELRLKRDRQKEINKQSNNAIIFTKNAKPPFTNPCFRNPCFTNPCFIIPRFTNPCFTNPRFTNLRFTNPCFTNPCFTNPVRVLQIQSSPCFTICPFSFERKMSAPVSDGKPK